MFRCKVLALSLAATFELEGGGISGGLITYKIYNHNVRVQSWQIFMKKPTFKNLLDY